MMNCEVKIETTIFLHQTIFIAKYGSLTTVKKKRNGNMFIFNAV